MPAAKEFSLRLWRRRRRRRKAGNGFFFFFSWRDFREKKKEMGTMMKSKSERFFLVSFCRNHTTVRFASSHKEKWIKVGTNVVKMMLWEHWTKCTGSQKEIKKGTVPFLSLSYTFPFALFHRKKKMGNLSKEEALEPKRLEEKKGYDTDFFLWTFPCREGPFLMHTRNSTIKGMGENSIESHRLMRR